MKQTYYGNAGLTRSAQREERQRKVKRCLTCGLDTWHELGTHGDMRGEWRILNLDGLPHRCPKRKLKEITHG